MAKKPRGKVSLYKTARVPVEDLDLLDKNARYMTNETFRNLVENVRKDGDLSSAPFCVKHGERYKVLSGNHRVRAAREAGLESVTIIYTDRKMSAQEQIAVQLSHNALEGEDDPKVLRELWDEIDLMDLKEYSGLDDKVLDEMMNVNLPALSEVNLEYRTLGLAFFPDEMDRVRELFDDVMEQIHSRDTSLAQLQDVYLARFEDFDRLMDELADTQAAYNVVNVATAFMLILDVFERHRTDLAEGWDFEEEETKRTRWVPLSSIIGGTTVPPEAAKVIKKAVERMVGREEVSVKAPWQAIEYWAADYLAGE